MALCIKKLNTALSTPGVGKPRLVTRMRLCEWPVAAVKNLKRKLQLIELPKNRYFPGIWLWSKMLAEPWFTPL